MRLRTSSEAALHCILFMLFLLAAGCGGSQQGTSPGPTASGLNFVPDTKPAPAVRWAEASLPAGTEMQVILLDRLNSHLNRIGDRFMAQVTEAVVLGDTVVVPAGSTLNGVVAQGRGGSLALAFNEITTPTGATAGIKARLSGSPASAGSRLDGVLEAHARMTLVLEEPLNIKVKQ